METLATFAWDSVCIFCKGAIGFVICAFGLLFFILLLKSMIGKNPQTSLTKR